MGEFDPIDPLEMVRNDNAIFEVEVFNPRTKQPVALTGTVRFTGRKVYTENPDDADAVFSVSSPIDIAITDGPNGKAAITMPASATADLPNERTELYVDIQIVQLGGRKQTVYRNKLIVWPEASMS